MLTFIYPSPMPDLGRWNLISFARRLLVSERSRLCQRLRRHLQILASHSAPGGHSGIRGSVGSILKRTALEMLFSVHNMLTEQPRL